MKRALAVLVGVVMVCVVAYLFLMNPTSVEFRLSATQTIQWPLGILMVSAFVAGAVLILSVVTLQAGRRAVVGWRQGRQQRRVERIEQWEERGEELVWNGDMRHGRGLLQKAWRRRPDGAYAVLALAASYRDTGDVQRARSLLAEAAAQHHTNPDILLALAEAHDAVGEHGACTEVLERLRALHPQAPRAL